MGKFPSWFNQIPWVRQYEVTPCLHARGLVYTIKLIPACKHATCKLEVTMNSVFYVGMDVHKETISIAVYEDSSQLPYSETVLKNNSVDIKKYFNNLLNKNHIIISCYEAGPTGFTLYRQLREMGITCSVVAPSMLPKKPGDRIKTDRKDAIILARALRNQEVTPIHVPTLSNEAARDYLRMYDDFKGELKRHKQHLLHFLLRIGKIYPGKTTWTREHYSWLVNLEFNSRINKSTFDEYFSAVCESEEKIHRIMDNIEEIATTKDYAANVSNLRCFKGISTITALSFLVEIGDFRRFSNAKSFMSYLGLVPSEYSSGCSRSVGSITKAGNKKLRRLLIEAGWHYRTYRPTKKLMMKRKNQKAEIIAYANKAGKRLNKKFNKMLFRGIRPQITVTAIARELSGFIWGMMIGKISI